MTIYKAAVFFGAIGGAGAVITASSCHSKTLLDLEVCATTAAANAAAPLLGDVTGILLGSTSQDQAQQAILDLGVKAGIAAVTCALDTVLRDLGGSLPTAKVAAAKPAPDSVTKAIQYGRSAREALLKKK